MNATLVISPYSKKGQHYIERYNNAKTHTIYDCYKSFSRAKLFAYNECLGWFAEEHGTIGTFKIISHNKMQFTAAWKREDGLRIETKCNSYIIPYDISDLPF